MPAQRVSKGFKDVSMSFKYNPLSGDLITLSNENAIARAVRNIVSTTPGEKFNQISTHKMYWRNFVSKVLQKLQLTASLHYPFHYQNYQKCNYDLKVKKHVAECNIKINSM